MCSIADRVARGLARFLLRIFYREIEIEGAERFPADGPALVVANHGNSLIDPFLLVGFLPRMPRFLAKSTLFSNPAVAPFLRLGGVIPVYRRQDAVDTSRNEETFARCFEELERDGVIGLFPEGISHDEPRLQPLKTGAARIALGAGARAGAAPIRIVPVGLTFEAKGLFRSRVLLQVGDVLAPPPQAERSEQEVREAVRGLTGRIDEAIRSLTLEHASWEDARLVERVARTFAIDAPEMPGKVPLSELFRLRKAFGEEHDRLRREDPERVARVEGMIARYEARLGLLGLRDHHVAAAYPWTEVALYVSDRMGLVAAVFPVAAVGTLIHWVPYRLAGIVGARVEQNPDLPATFKLMASVFFFPVTWALVAYGVGRSAGFWPGVVALLVAPATGWFALLFHERHASFWSEFRAWAVLRLRKGRVAELRARRSALREEIAALVDEKGPDAPHS
jgi:1-acyl-sn-glycerol-3-phosphate acyltransferase